MERNAIRAMYAKLSTPQITEQASGEEGIRSLFGFDKYKTVRETADSLNEELDKYIPTVLKGSIKCNVFEYLNGNKKALYQENPYTGACPKISGGEFPDKLKLQSQSSPIGKGKKRLAGGGRKLTFVDLDNQLAQWVRQHRLQKHRISRRIIQQQDERMFNAELGEGQFKASIGWLEINTAVIPGGCMKYIQAPDVVWNGPFKEKLQELYNKWIMNGNRRPASMNVYLNWICIAWDSLPKEMIVKSFKDCGIIVCHDGSEDGLIHCFKEHGQVPEGRLMLEDARAWLDVEQRQADEFDAEQDEENGYMSNATLNFHVDE